MDEDGLDNAICRQSCDAVDEDRNCVDKPFSSGGPGSGSQECENGCETCEGDICTSCEAGFYRYVIDENSATCVEKCNRNDDPPCIEQSRRNDPGDGTDIISFCGGGCMSCKNDLWCNRCHSDWFRHVFVDEDNFDRAICR